MSKRTRSSGRRWRFTAGDRGCRVAVFEREPGGLLYARTTGARGEDIRVSLGHRDREQAKAYALDQAAKLRQGRDDIRAERLSLARLFALYAVHRTPRKTPNEQNEDRRRTTMWTRVLGAQKDAAKITRGEWEGFAELRASGELNAQGEPVRSPKLRRPVRSRSVQRDMLWLKWVLNWATSWQNADGRYLLTANPVRGFDVPSEKNPRRPVASTDRLEKVLAAAETLEMEIRWDGKARRQRAYLADILSLAAETGRRISAILGLRWDDIVWDARPHGAIRWRADEDKMGQEWTAPLSPKARAVIDRLRRERPGLGNALLFPSPVNPEEQVSYEGVRCWLTKAEELAKVAKQQGGSFHPTDALGRQLGSTSRSRTSRLPAGGSPRRYYCGTTSSRTKPHSCGSLRAG